MIFKIYWVYYVGHGMWYFPTEEKANENFEHIKSASEGDPIIEMGYVILDLTESDIIEKMANLLQYGAYGVISPDGHITLKTFGDDCV